ncbi:NFX1-type zinc finger-containing protein 1 [Homalodisca vitripennis]|nr:NFX1-type zinc finger-containing protein 1 [Homalodisca vitripennis]
MLVSHISRQEALKVVNASKKTHRLRWQSHRGQALGKRLLADSSSGFTRWLMGLGRDRVKQVIALITGHGHFRKHLNTLGLRNEDSETAKHIILDCERLGARRRALFGDKQPGDEPDANSSSKQNTYEADFLIALCQYLLLQGYKPDEITILATYSGQVWCLRKEKRRLALQNPDWRNVRITAVDNFQGEENRIILLSLVRSNTENRIGFLSEENRVCVALSRARDGLYIVGNMDNLTASSAIWPRIKQQLEEIGAVGGALTLRCERHPSEMIQVSTAQQFSKSPQGGCLLKCDTILECGHLCPRVCHIIDRYHTEYKCSQSCERYISTKKSFKLSIIMHYSILD